MICNCCLILAHYNCVCILVLTTLNMATSGRNMSLITT